jgi:hypothetical protein
MKKDNPDLTEQTVYVLNGITFLPHYTLPCYVAPGFTRLTPTKMWSVWELLEAGAVKGTAFLWPRGLLAQNTEKQA